MAARSLNKVLLIGNMTRDPELRYTPQGTAVCTFGLATNRTWVTDNGDKKEETEFHRIVAWNKLAELCSQLLFKGRRIYVEGRLQTRQWTGQDGSQRVATEIVIEDMIILDSKAFAESQTAGQTSGGEYMEETPQVAGTTVADQGQAAPPDGGTEPVPVAPTKKPVGRGKSKEKDEAEKVDSQEVAEDIPF